MNPSRTEQIHSPFILAIIMLAFIAANAMTAAPASADNTRDIVVHLTNNSDSVLKFLGSTLDHGCWSDVAAPPDTIEIDQTVVIASRSCGFATGTEFSLSYTVENTGTRMILHYEAPFVGTDEFAETAPLGYKFVASGVIENRTTVFGCDSACDGIPDEWKTKGATIDPGDGTPLQRVELQKMGVSHDRPNVLVQLDWMADDKHNQQLRQAAIDTVIRAFDQDPMTHRGATRPGITLIVDAGRNSTITPGGATWGDLSRAQAVPWTENFLTGNRTDGYQEANFNTLLKNNFVPTGRLPIFHYAVAAANIAQDDGTTGDTLESKLGFMVTLGPQIGAEPDQNKQTSVFMHELGHTLGLDHSGGEGNDVNLKPNYPSIMNYAWEPDGVLRGGDHVFDYSRDFMPEVNEADLTEQDGVFLGSNRYRYGTTHSCKTIGEDGKASIDTIVQPKSFPVDWNCNKNTPDSGKGFDANADGKVGPLKSSTPDWYRLEFLTGGVGAGYGAKDTITIPSSGMSAPTSEPTLEQLRRTRELPLDIALSYTGASSGAYHESATMSATLLDPGDGNSPIPSRTITFRIGSSASDVCSAVTDTTGTASCSITLTQAPGTYTITASFADGDPIYKAGSDTSHSFTIDKQRTALTYTGATYLANGTPSHLAAVLKEDGILGTAPIATRTLTFALGSGANQQTCTATTDTTGLAACTIPAVNQPLTPDATIPVTVTFAGDPYYEPSSATTTLKLQYMTGRAYGLSAAVHLLLVSLNLQPTPDTGAIRTATATTTAPPCAASLNLLVSAHALCEIVTTQLNPGGITATSTATDATIGILGLPVITLTGIRASSTSQCGAATGTTTIGSLKIGGVPVTIPTAPNSTINVAGLAQLTINEQHPITGADHGLSVTAVHFTGLNGTVDVVIGSTTSAVYNCAPPGTT